MISDSINTQRTLKRTLANRVDQNQKQKGAESDQVLHYLLTLPETWEIGYHKDPIATGSTVKRCNF